MVRGKGRTTEDIVFTIIYGYFWKEYLKVLGDIGAEIEKWDCEGMLLQAFRIPVEADPAEAYEKIKRESDDQFERIKPLFQKYANLREVIEKIDEKYQGRVAKANQHLSYIYDKLGLGRYVLDKIDPAMIHVHKPEFYRLFKLDLFKGDVVTRKINNPYAKVREARIYVTRFISNWTLYCRGFAASAVSKAQRKVGKVLSYK